MKKFIFSIMFVFGLGMMMSSCGNSTKSADAVTSDTDSVDSTVVK